MRLNVLGVPVEVTPASREAAAICRCALGVWQAECEIVDRPPARLGVSLAGPSDAPGGRVSVKMERRVLSIRSAAGLGWADPSDRLAEACLSPEAAGFPEDASILLETLAVYLAQSSARPVTLHAAALVWNGRCVLVTGEEGAGKSTLSCACVRAGFGLVSEDACFAASPEIPLRIWGIPWRLSLLPDAAGLFSGLCGAPRATMLNGETKVRLAIPRCRAVREARVAGTLLLRRTDGQSSLQPLDDGGDLVRTLVLRGGPERSMEPSLRAARLLAAGPRALLQFGPDIDRAVVLARDWAERL